MTSTIVWKSLELVDPSTGLHGSKKKNQQSTFNRNTVHNFSHEHSKNHKGKDSNQQFQSQKVSVAQVRKNFKSKDRILQENLKKLELIKKVCTIHLDKEATKCIIERAVTKRPTKQIIHKKKRDKNTAFTEEDFAKFEAEYFGD